MTPPSPQRRSQVRQRPLRLVIRFSSSLPDLNLDIPSPETTSVVALKSLIRARLDEPHNSHSLRFIYQGKILQDAAALSTALGPSAFAPTNSSSDSDRAHDGQTEDKGKGGKGKAPEGRAPESHRVYIICSIGDALSPADLAAEEVAARKPPSSAANASRQQGSSHNQARGQGQDLGQQGTASTNAPPPASRGFDRLLATGFTTAEISQLRLQFRDIQSQRHTPDTMPSPDTLRSMEDTWMDANAGDALPGGGGGGGNEGSAGWGWGGGGGATVGGAAGPDDSLGAMHEQLDGLVKGMLMGFFWPMGGIAWLTREEGMIAQLWRVWIGFGVSFSVFVGIMRTMFGATY